MTDFAPAAVPRGSLHAPLPPTSRLTLLRRRLTISGLAASSEADCALAGQIDRRRPGGSKLKSWFTSRSSGRQSSIGFEDDLQQNSMLSVGVSYKLVEKVDCAKSKEYDEELYHRDTGS